MKLGFIGTGNMASNLASAFFNAGYEITSFYSRELKHGKELAKKFNSSLVNDINSFENSCDIIFITTPDSEIENFGNEIKKSSTKIIVHCSGSTALNSLNQNNIGVFYPLQTLTKNKLSGFKEVPIIIEASNDQTMNTLISLANSISSKVVEMNSEQRLKLHLGAVVINNFVYFINSLGREWLIQNKIEAELLKPLALKTLENSFTNLPFSMQTGPAARNDVKTIEHHLEMLQNNEELKLIYKMISELISKKLDTN